MSFVDEVLLSMAGSMAGSIDLFLVHQWRAHLRIVGSVWMSAWHGHRARGSEKPPDMGKMPMPHRNHSQSRDASGARGPWADGHPLDLPAVDRQLGLVLREPFRPGGWNPTSTPSSIDGPPLKRPSGQLSALLTELCDVLGVSRSGRPDTAQNAYVFERGVTFQHRAARRAPAASISTSEVASTSALRPSTEPVLHKFQNIENRDRARVRPRGVHHREDGRGRSEDPRLPDNWRDAVQPHTGYLCVWDRKTTKTDPVTGRQVPDGKAIVPLRRYVNPRPAWWPQADFIVGKSPVLGASRMRDDRAAVMPKPCERRIRK